jgi:hypothetical protein
MRWLKQWLAIRRLNKLVARRKSSVELEIYRRHRAAALKHTRGTC